MPENCEVCHNAIRDTTVTFEKKPYHPECFVCHQCRKQLSGKLIYKHEGHNYDQECYALFHAKKCAVCYHALTDTNVKYVTYDGKSFHPDCFLCSKCKKTLQGKAIYKHENENYCKDCYGTTHARKCGKCYQPLVEANVKYVTYGDEAFHPHCFLCAKCNKTLQGQEFYLVEDEKVCTTCY